MHFLSKPRIIITIGVIIIMSLAVFLYVQRSSFFRKRYIFIDGGAYRGQIIELFIKTNFYSRHPWEIYAFEPNPGVINEIPKRPNLIILNKALWSRDEFIKFYLAGKDVGSSSVVKEKRTGRLNLNEPIEVEAVNFGKWIKRNFKMKDVILVNLDIEGAEYEVLQSMLRENTIGYIDELYVEFHNVKVNVSREVDEKLVSAL